MKTKASGQLHHHFHMPYWASMALVFTDSYSAETALSKLGPGWSQGDSAKGKNFDKALVWAGNSEELDECKKVLVSFSVAMDIHYHDQLRELMIIAAKKNPAIRDFSVTNYELELECGLLDLSREDMAGIIRSIKQIKAPVWGVESDTTEAEFLFEESNIWEGIHSFVPNSFTRLVLEAVEDNCWNIEKLHEFLAILESDKPLEYFLDGDRVPNLAIHLTAPKNRLVNIAIERLKK